MKVSVKVENQREMKEDFQKQMIGSARDDAIMQRSKLILISFEKETTMGLVVTSNKKIDLLFEKRMFIYCLFENLQVHDSEERQQMMWIPKLESKFGYSKENISVLTSEPVS